MGRRLPAHIEEDRRERSRRLSRPGLGQFSLQLFFGPLAALGLLALEDLAGGRKLFSHPGQSNGNSLPLTLIRCGGQWSVT